MSVIILVSTARACDRQDDGNDDVWLCDLCSCARAENCVTFEMSRVCNPKYSFKMRSACTAIVTATATSKTDIFPFAAIFLLLIFRRLNFLQRSAFVDQLPVAFFLAGIDFVAMTCVVARILRQSHISARKLLANRDSIAGSKIIPWLRMMSHRIRSSV